ncbi:MAG: hypothetical protein ACRD5J_08720 [Nitrososphaeraceae archaeon]
MMKTRSYKETNDFIVSQILFASSNVRSVSLLNPNGMLKGFKMRDDVSLLLSPEQMGGLAVQLNKLVRSLFKYSKKIGFLHYLYLDFDDVHALVFQLADRNLLLIIVEKMENDVPRFAKFVSRLLEKNEMTYDR